MNNSVHVSRYNLKVIPSHGPLSNVVIHIVMLLCVIEKMSMFYIIRSSINSEFWKYCINRGIGSYISLTNAIYFDNHLKGPQNHVKCSHYCFYSITLTMR